MTVALNFPTNRNIVGENLWTSWSGGLPGAWPDWSTWWPFLRKAIDHAYGIGCNTVRMIGDMSFVRSGAFTQAQYDARWAILIEYCARLGLYVYPCMTGAFEFQMVSPILSTSEMATSIIATHTSWVRQGYTNIIGVDLMNEGNSATNGSIGTTQVTTAQAIALAQAVRAGGQGFPLTISSYEPFNTAPPWIGGYVAGQLAFYLDFLDFHVYNVGGSWGSITAPTPSTLQSGPFTWWPLDIIFGEFGERYSLGATARRAWIDNSQAMYGTDSTGTGGTWKQRGGFHWNIYDQDTDTTNMWGSFDTSWGDYTEQVRPIVNVSGTASSPSAPTLLANPRTGVLVVSPYGTTTDFTSVKIYKDGSLVATQGHGYYEDAAMNDRTGHSYKASVVNGSAVEGAQSTALVTANSPCKGASASGSPVIGS